MKSDWESFHRVYFLTDDSVELKIYTIFIYKKNNYKIRMKMYVQKGLPVCLDHQKLEIGQVEIRTGQRSSHKVSGLHFCG